MTNSKKKVAVAMSGGVDSSTASLLLKQQGYEVTGFTGIMNNSPQMQQAAENAKKICDFIGIEHKSINLIDEFRIFVMDYFEQSYKKGFTPNPCIFCNKTIKWGVLFDIIQEKLDIDYYATGHYAKISEENGIYKLCKAKDDNKDQIYMLCALSQKQLSKTLFPLSDYTKAEIRQIAKENNLLCAETKDSQDICFIHPPDTTKNYLLRKFGEKEGDFVDFQTGKIIGKHNGFYQYTIGQRKGIGIAASEPLYVIRLDSVSNTVFVGSKELLYEKEVNLINVNWQQAAFSCKEFHAMVKIRYNTSAKPALIIPDGIKAKIIFDEPQSGVTPGQFGVIYEQDNTCLIAGGVII